MLLGNGALIFRQPLRLRGGTVSGDRALWGRGDRYNAMVGGTSTVFGGMPSGYRHPVTWTLPITPGALASRTLIDGTGGATADPTAGRNIEAALSGSGGLTQSDLSLIVSLVAELSGAGTFAGDVVGAGGMEAALSGTGDLAGERSALGNLVAALTGAGAVEAVLTALGSMAADLTVTGGTLTTANVADAVWGAAAEAGYTYDEVLRIIAAVVAGKSSGGPDSPVFTALDGTTTRVEGEADSDGNRTSVTYSP